MQAFEYASPTSLKEALASLGNSWEEAAILAGGTDLISLMKDHIVHTNRVVNIKNVKGLSGISRSGGGIRIGATTTLDELLESPLLRDYPSLTAAARGVNSPQIRNMGTVAGDLCQRTRCWYFRNGFGLLAIKDGKSMVENGQNEFHAIFHNGPAKFVSASSLGPALIALGAKIKIASAAEPNGREVDAASFFVTPSSDSDREVALKPNEIVTEILVPGPPGKNATYEVRNKEGLDWPLATASVVLKMNGAAVSSASIVLGHVGPTPVVASGAAASLSGKSITEETAAAAGKAAVASAKPLSDNGYKVHLASVAVKRALLAAAGVRA
jgi:xanthine dehydrogenase YagS FAD-binding subunit